MGTSQRVSCCGEKCWLSKLPLFSHLLIIESVWLRSLCLGGTPLYLENIDSVSCFSPQSLYSTQPIPSCPGLSFSQLATFTAVCGPGITAVGELNLLTQSCY